MAGPRDAAQHQRVAYKVALVGTPCAGKTAFLKQLTKGQFSSGYQPTTVEFQSWSVDLPHGQRVTLQFWDIGGVNAPGKLLSTYLSNCQAVLAMYDVCSAQSFAGVLQWLDTCRAASGGTLPYLALVACKSDLEDLRAVSEEDHQHLAHTLGLYSYSTSSLTGDGVRACAYRVAADLAGVPLSVEQLEQLAGPCRELPGRLVPADEAYTGIAMTGVPRFGNPDSGVGGAGGGGGGRGGSAGAGNVSVGAPPRRPMLSRGPGSAGSGGGGGRTQLPHLPHLDLPELYAAGPVGTSAGGGRTAGGTGAAGGGGAGEGGGRAAGGTGAAGEGGAGGGGAGEAGMGGAGGAGGGSAPGSARAGYRASPLGAGSAPGGNSGVRRWSGGAYPGPPGLGPLPLPLPPLQSRLQAPSAVPMILTDDQAAAGPWTFVGLHSPTAQPLPNRSPDSGDPGAHNPSAAGGGGQGDEEGGSVRLGLKDVREGGARSPSPTAPGLTEISGVKRRDTTNIWACCWG